MIIDWIINSLQFFLNGLYFFIPQVTLSSIPLIGGFIRNSLITAVRLFNSTIDTIPYLQVVWTVFLFILSFELLMLVLKLILGSRTPTSSNH